MTSASSKDVQSLAPATLPRFVSFTLSYHTCYVSWVLPHELQHYISMYRAFYERGPGIRPQGLRTNVQWNTLESASPHITCHKQRLMICNWLYKMNCPQTLHSSMSTSYSVWIDDETLQRIQESPYPLLNTEFLLPETFYMDVFLFCPVVLEVSFSIKLFCILFNLSFGHSFRFSIFSQFEDFIVRFISIWNTSAQRYIKKRSPVLNFCTLVYIMIIFNIYITYYIRK